MRYMVKTLYYNLLLLVSLTGEEKGTISALPTMKCDLGDSNLSIRGFNRTRLPVRVYLAITVNKAPGGTFCGTVGLVLSDTFFSHG